MHGILLVDKPVGPTSHDVVNLLRRRTGLRRVGHAGTLDPMASGLLVLVLGPATRWAASLMQSEKEYDVTIQLGVGTDTGDATGRVVAQAPAGWHAPAPAELITQLQRCVGELAQVPPMFSAIKYQGQPLYRWARRGVTVPRRPRQVHIYRWDLRQYAPPSLTSVVQCSRGTYIRALADTLGERLGCPAHVTALRRLRSGTFHVAEAVTWDWLARATSAQIAERLIAAAPVAP